MTGTPIPASTPVRLHGHWRDPVRVEATDAFTCRRAAKALHAAGCSVTAAPRGSHDLWCDDLDARSLRRALIEAGIPAVIATVTRPTPAEEAEVQRPTPDAWAPF